ncbi:hypothetical protein ABG067_008154, partial [Albugo candida]
MANKMFQVSNKNRPFKMGSAYLLLSGQPKWVEYNDRRASEEAAQAAGGTNAAATDDVEASSSSSSSSRPMGRKQSKALARQKRSIDELFDNFSNQLKEHDAMLAKRSCVQQEAIDAQIACQDASSIDDPIRRAIIIEMQADLLDRLRARRAAREMENAEEEEN